jgi:hypothetical protein
MNDVKVYTKAKQDNPVRRVWRPALHLLQADKRGARGCAGL